MHEATHEQDGGFYLLGGFLRSWEVDIGEEPKIA